MSVRDIAYMCGCGQAVPIGCFTHVCHGISAEMVAYTPPKIPDELNVPLTRRDALFVVQVVVEIQQANPLLAQSDLWPLVWERLTLAWRQPDVHQPSREEL